MLAELDYAIRGFVNGRSGGSPAVIMTAVGYIGELDRTFCVLKFRDGSRLDVPLYARDARLLPYSVAELARQVYERVCREQRQLAAVSGNLDQPLPREPRLSRHTAAPVVDDIPRDIRRQIAADYRKAEEKSRLLLREWLSPEQRSDYDRSGSFIVAAPSGRRYRINTGIAYNIEELDESGAPIQELCVLPTGCPWSGDIMLAQKIAFESDERSALRLANRRPVQVRNTQTWKQRLLSLTRLLGF